MIFVIIMISILKSLSTWCGHRGTITGPTAYRYFLFLTTFLALAQPLQEVSGQFVNATPPPLDQGWYDVAELVRDNQFLRRELSRAQKNISSLHDQLDELRGSSKEVWILGVSSDGTARGAARAVLVGVLLRKEGIGADPSTSGLPGGVVLSGPDVEGDPGDWEVPAIRDLGLLLRPCWVVGGSQGVPYGDGRVSSGRSGESPDSC